MKVTAELKSELEKYGFKYFKIAGNAHFTNSNLQQGIEIKSNHINPYVIDSTGKNYSPGKLHEDTELCITIIENMSELAEGAAKTLIMKNTDEIKQDIADALNPAKKYLETGELVEYIEETAIVPQNLTAALLAKHLGTIPCLLSMQQTNPAEIKTMIDANGNPVIRNGSPVKYVTGDYVQRCLNYACLFDWDFEGIETREDLIDGKQYLAVYGKLTIRTTEGKTISKTQWGSQILRAKMEPGDALKGANTDSLKKCASALGIARDVYAGEV